MSKNTIYTKKSQLDQFYTSSDIAKKCYDEVIKKYPNNQFSLYFEPSAGSGAFFNLFPLDKRLGIDLDPQCKEVKQQDFFNFIPPSNQNIITIGNPPFGKNSSIAVKFFNKAAEFSSVIAFIIPKTFQKKSIQNKLNPYFHLKLNIDLPKNSFILNNQPYDVPCCFQIWEKIPYQRKINKSIPKTDLFDFVKKKEADLAVRRVGGRAGKANKDITGSSETTHYFLKMKNGTSVDWLLEKINSIDFSRIVNATAGVKSLSKPELLIALKKIK